MKSPLAAEARLIFLAADSVDRPPRGDQPEVEAAKEGATAVVPIKVYGQAQSMLNRLGATIEGATITIAGRRLSFDQDTKEVGVFSHKGEVFIEITNVEGPNQTVIIGKNGEFKVRKAEQNKKRGERPLASVLAVKDARKWVKNLKINGDVARQLQEARKAGLSIEDNQSKSNGLTIFKNGHRIGDVAVYLNPRWEEDLSRLVESAFLNTFPDE